MPVEHLKPEDGADRVAELLERDGCVIVDGVASPAEMASFREEMGPYLKATPAGVDGFTGRATRRTGALIARSEQAREWIQHPLVLGATAKLLAHVTNYQLHLTQVIAIGPGEKAQEVHRDQWAFDFFPFPNGYEVQCNTIWALTDFTEENGATRVIPGSHRHEDKLRYGIEDTEPAEMKAGSVLFYTGSIYHGGGPNRSDAVRMGVNITYVVGFLRQEENQYLSVPREIAATLPKDLLRLMGYARGSYALGYIDDTRDPIAAVRPELIDEKGMGDLTRVQLKNSSLADR